MQPARPSTLTDETVGSFLARRVDERIANNVVSAVFHGIYAGDIWQLSAKTLLGLGWQLEGRYGTALGGYLKLQNERQSPEPTALAHPYDVEAARAMNEEIDIDVDLAQNMRSAAMFTWKDGLQTLVKGLKDAMEKTGNIDIKLNSPVASFKMAQDTQQKVEIIAGVRLPVHHTSTLY
jgi:oxygen-dependent protoporphyrinogen oxidase